MPGEELGRFGLDRRRREIADAAAQYVGELIVEGTWLNQLDNVSFDTTYRSFGGEVSS